MLVERYSYGVPREQLVGGVAVQDDGDAGGVRLAHQLAVDDVDRAPPRRLQRVAGGAQRFVELVLRQRVRLDGVLGDRAFAAEVVDLVRLVLLRAGVGGGEGVEALAGPLADVVC